MQPPYTFPVEQEFPWHLIMIVVFLVMVGAVVAYYIEKRKGD